MKIFASLLSLLFFFSAQNDSKPETKLVVLISVDQMRGDYLERYRPLLTGGFKNLVEEGAVFTNCYYDYANTETGPGHATLSTGRNPSSHGIVENGWFDRNRKKDIYCVADPEAKPVASDEASSPKNLIGSTLGDWMLTKDKNSKIISISGKDRAAILLGGKKANLALWYSVKNGIFGTSDYYVKSLPSWVEAWNAKSDAKTYAGKKWERLLPEAKYRECGASEDLAKGEAISDFPKAEFPYALKEQGPILYKQILRTPFIDELCFSLAREAVEKEKLGQRDSVDLLCLSFSALDYVGHSCGPESQEAGDVFLRLDVELGKFLAFLKTKLGDKAILLALSADHGVLSLPEWSETQKLPTRRVGGEIKEAFKSLDKALKEKFGEGNWIISSDSRTLYLNRELCKEKKIDLENLQSEIISQGKKMDFVDSVYLAEEIEAKKKDNSICHYLFNSYMSQRSGDVFFVAKEFFYISDKSTGTGHGTPWSYDRFVPLVFWGASVAHGIHKDSAHPTDLAATLAGLLRLTPDSKLDGNSWTEKIQASRKE